MRDAALFTAGAAFGAAAAGLAAAAVAKRREKRLGRFISFAAHELNTPVTALTMTTLNLLGGVFGEVPAAHRPWLDMAREQVLRLGGVLGELRDYSHIVLKGDFRPILEDARPEELFERALASARRGYEQAGAPLESSAAADLPVVRCDPERAARSLSSLLFHARKFRVSGPVTATAKPAGKGVSFRVAYTGPRLPPGETARSLDPHYPARDRSDQILSATGAGLGVVRLVLERCGGGLEFRVENDGRAELVMRLGA